MGSIESSSYMVDQVPPSRVLGAIADWVERVFLPPRHLPRRAQLGGLLRVTDDLLCLDEVVDTVVRSCASPGPVRGEVARRAQHADVWCGRLRDELTELDVEPALGWFRDELALAIEYRLALVRAATQLAFSNDARRRADDARSGLTGVGDRVETLLLLRAQLVMALPRYHGGPEGL